VPPLHSMSNVAAVVEEVWARFPETIDLRHDPVSDSFKLVIYDLPEPTHWTMAALGRPPLMSERDLAVWMDEQVEAALTRHRWPYNRLTPVADLMAPAGDMMVYLGYSTQES
jgi:hypothetical protein